MTTLANNLFPPEAVKQYQRFHDFWRKLFAPGDLTALLIAIGLLLMPALSLQAASWPLEMAVIIPVLILSILFGFLLSRSRYNELVALMMSGVYGGCFILLLSAISQPGGLRNGVYSVFAQVVEWIFAALTAGIDQNDLIFTMLVASLFWFLGYNIAWHIFRVDRVFRVILPPGLIIVTNTAFYNGNADLNRYLIAYTFLALLLVVRSNLDARLWDWYLHGLRVPARVRRQFNLVGAVLALVVVMGSWAVPSSNIEQRLDRFQEFLQSNPIQQMGEVWNRLFSTIEAYGPVTADYYGGDSLQLSGAIQLGDQVVMLVEAPPGRRYYWRSRVFDTYQDGNWTSQANKRLTDTEAPFEVQGDVVFDGVNELVQQRFTVGLSASRLLYTAPQPVQIDLAVQADIRDVPELNTTNIYAARPLRVLERNDVYTAASLMSTATAEQLRNASTDYPQWVRDTQLYVPPSVTGRTLALAQQVVTEAGATTPYDKAKAIESWLRENIRYNESIPQPPPGQDPVDWVLFDYREGYCNYYSSAMVMMLRAQGIPSRMSAGFAQGELENNVYVVRERDAHTWVEVYFPGYGWVEFEPTAAQLPIDRGDSQLPPPPTATPFSSPTPTLTPTPSPTPTLDPAVAPPAEDEAPSLPTITPTFTPSPTATPVIIPTSPPPVSSPPRGALAFILPAIGTALIGLALLLMLAAIAVFVWWWWEWRGMRGLSPVVRAYARLERYMSGLLRFALRDEETPDERRRRIVDALPRRAERPVSAITHMYTVERYGQGVRSPEDAARQEQGVDRAWSRTRENILNRFASRFVPFKGLWRGRK